MSFNPDPADDPNDAYAVIPMLARPRGLAGILTRFRDRREANMFSG
jgi:hypothetical protein